jgi:hypothetical protein
LLTRTSMVPNVSMTLAVPSSTCCSFVTSNQRLISSYQQSFGLIEMLRADVLMGALTYGGFESQDI